MTTGTLWIIGAGGHAKVVIATARASGWSDLRIVDDESHKWKSTLLGVPITGPPDPILVDPDAIAVLAIGNNVTRARIAASARCQFATLVHSHAVVDPSCELGAGTVVFAGAIVQPDAKVGAHAIVNTSASIDHDARIGHAVHVAPGAHLCGNVTIGDLTLVGVGASIRPGITVGARVTIGAGSAVVSDLCDGVTVVGVPARPR